VLGHQVSQPARQIDGAIAVVLGRAPHQLPGVQLVELPLHRDGLLADVLGIQPDRLTPPQGGVQLEYRAYELVVPAAE
jgi:hypothetical protein